MADVTTTSKTVPVILECDVLVVGAGMSGFAAAVSAARAGAKTVLAEKNHFPGGVATSGLMCSVSNYFLTRDGTQVTTGLPIELIDRIVSEGGGQPNYMRPGQPQIPNEPEITKRVMIKMLREAGVTSLYESVLTDVITDPQGKATHCVFQGRDSSFAVGASQFVDSSGDLAVFRRAGGKYEERNDGATLLYRMGNVDIDKIVDWFEEHPDSYDADEDIPTSLEDTIRSWREYGVFHLPHGGGSRIAVVKDALESGAYSDTFGKHYQNLKCFGLFSCTANRGTVLINSNWYFDECYDIVNEGEREEEGRLLIEPQSEFLQKYFPGFENSYLLESATEIGHRISRRAICKREFGHDEFKDGVPMEDNIGLATEVDRRSRPFGLMTRAGQLPLSMLISNEAPNVVVGSAKNPYTAKWGMIRGQAGCLVMGRGAGVAAAVAARDAADVVTVNIANVQDELRKQNTRLEP